MFWISSEHQRRLSRCKNIFYCPNGHSQVYLGESDKQKTEELKRKLRNQEYENQALARSNASLRGVITRNKKKKGL